MKTKWERNETEKNGKISTNGWIVGEMRQYNFCYSLEIQRI